MTHFPELLQVCENSLATPCRFFTFFGLRGNLLNLGCFIFFDVIDEDDFLFLLFDIAGTFPRRRDLFRVLLDGGEDMLLQHQ